MHVKIPTDLCQASRLTDMKYSSFSIPEVTYIHKYACSSLQGGDRDVKRFECIALL